jgi:hypothetical protein
MSGLREEFRTVIVRERSGRWWRRWRWAVEERRMRDWDLLDSGYNFTLPNALHAASVKARPLAAKISRVEIATHVEHVPYDAKAPSARSPLPPQILTGDQSEAAK